MEYKIDYSDGIICRGNANRLKVLMKRAETGGTYTIGFIGGSITQGAVATDNKFCYAYLVYDWWVNHFKNAEFIFVNAGIGATDSQFACARVWEDLLSKSPDFVVTEFSVNDENTELSRETYEGLLRQVYGYDSKPAVIVMNNVFYDTGRNAEDQHVALARHYHIPALSVRPTLYKLVKDGDINARDITPDNLHPNDLGHSLVAGQITYYLDTILESVSTEEPEVMLAPALTANTYEGSKRFNNRTSEPKLLGFVKDDSPQQGVWDCFKGGWTASKIGDKIIFKIKGTNFSVQYKKTCKHPAPVAKLILDGDTDNSILLDANFDETWGDKLFLTTIAKHIEEKEHEIVIELVETHENDTAPFYLAAVLS